MLGFLITPAQAARMRVRKLMQEVQRHKVIDYLVQSALKDGYPTGHRRHREYVEAYRNAIHLEPDPWNKRRSANLGGGIYGMCHSTWRSPK